MTKCELLSLLNELMMLNTGSCWEKRDLLSCHPKAFVSRTHLALMPQSQLAMGPKPFAQCWKEAAVFHNPSLTQCYYQVSFAQLDLGMVLSASGKPTQEVCENGAGDRRLGPLCLRCLVRSCYLNSLFHLWDDGHELRPQG